MPKAKQRTKRKPGGPGTTSTEALGWIGGLYAEFCEQVKNYHALTGELLSLQARVELKEKNLVVTRDHLALQIEKSEEEMPTQWAEMIKYARFVGMRLADACIMVVKERKRITHTGLLVALNKGMFRFRTNAPLREIQGAMARQPFIKRTSDAWIWMGPDTAEAATTSSEDAGAPPLRLVSSAEGSAVNGAVRKVQHD